MSAPKALQMSESNDWYTPARYVEAARFVMGSIDLDPASSEIANRTVKAARIYTIETDGLATGWQGRIWLNPPYGYAANGQSNQELWASRLVQEYEQGNIEQAILLVNAVTDRLWFQRLWAYTICFTNHRIHFYAPDGKQGSPTHGNALVYFGPNVARFADVFRQFGVVVGRNGVTFPADNPKAATQFTLLVQS